MIINVKYFDSEGEDYRSWKEMLGMGATQISAEKHVWPQSSNQDEPITVVVAHYSSLKLADTNYWENSHIWKAPANHYVIVVSGGSHSLTSQKNQVYFRRAPVAKSASRGRPLADLDFKSGFKRFISSLACAGGPDFSLLEPMSSETDQAAAAVQILMASIKAAQSSGVASVDSAFSPAQIEPLCKRVMADLPQNGAQSAVSANPSSQTLSDVVKSVLRSSGHEELENLPLPLRPY